MAWARACRGHERLVREPEVPDGQRQLRVRCLAGRGALGDCDGACGVGALSESALNGSRSSGAGVTDFGAGTRGTSARCSGVLVLPQSGTRFTMEFPLMKMLLIHPP